MARQIHPDPFNGPIDQCPLIEGYEWLHRLIDKKIYLKLWHNWFDVTDLPHGYDYYIISYHLEAVNLEYILKQSKLVSSPIIVLFDGNDYGLNLPGVFFIPYFYWHYQLKNIDQLFGRQPESAKVYKYSAICNRISQSKVWITTKLLETERNQSLIALNNWVNPNSVHNWMTTGNSQLDSLTDTFKEKYLGHIIKFDDFDNTTDNVQSINSNPWQPAITQVAVNFTNESFHYSFMSSSQGDYIYPGPFLTEKTFKCLIGGTTMVPVGQFDTYGTLSRLGLCFDYGFDTSWDQDSGNISRFSKLVTLIDTLRTKSIADLEFKEIGRYNQNYINSGKFFQSCTRSNLDNLDKIFSLIV